MIDAATITAIGGAVAVVIGAVGVAAGRVMKALHDLRTVTYAAKQTADATRVAVDNTRTAVAEVGKSADQAVAQTNGNLNKLHQLVSEAQQRTDAQQAAQIERLEARYKDLMEHFTKTVQMPTSPIVVPVIATAPTAAAPGESAEGGRRADDRQKP